MNEALKEPVLFEEEHKVVQKNTPYYDVKWAFVEDPARHNTWNWIAFFFSAFWLTYRKMYKPFIVLAIIEILWMIPFFLMDIPQWLHIPFYLIIALVAGRNANRWYYNYVTQVLNQARSLPAPKQSSYLLTKGGTNVGIMLGLNAVFFLLFFISLTALSSLPTETNVKDIVRLSDESYTLEALADEPTWKYVKKENRYHVVEFTGHDFSKNEDVRIVFHVYQDKQLFQWKQVYLNNKKLSEKDAKDYQMRIENNS
jgi:hypothetical protein